MPVHACVRKDHVIKEDYQVRTESRDNILQEAYGLIIRVVVYNVSEPKLRKLLELIILGDIDWHPRDTKNSLPLTFCSSQKPCTTF